MDQTRTELFLDHAWSRVGQIHQWLSKWEQKQNQLDSTSEIISSLQQLWSMADDLGVMQIRRVCLALEQTFERLSACQLESTKERSHDILAGIECLQELLLGLEATREEPAIASPDVIRRLEAYASLGAPPPAILRTSQNQEQTTENPFFFPTAESIEPTIADGQVQQPEFAVAFNPLESSTKIKSILSSNVVESRTDQPLNAILEQFVMKLEYTCHQLHLRMVQDETPYFTTTSRLEHLSQETRDLVEQIARESRTIAASSFDDHAETIGLTNVSGGETPLSNESNDEHTGPVILTSNEQHAPSSTDSFDATSPDDDPMPKFSRRILIVDDSLFFRHLIGMAAQSAGYFSDQVESGPACIAALDAFDNFASIVIGSELPDPTAQAIERYRISHGATLIGMQTSDHDDRNNGFFDKWAAKSHPGQLIAILDGLCPESIDLRKIA